MFSIISSFLLYKGKMDQELFILVLLVEMGLSALTIITYLAKHC